MQQNSRIIVLTLDAAREAGTALAVSYDLLEGGAPGRRARATATTAATPRRRRRRRRPWPSPPLRPRSGLPRACSARGGRPGADRGRARARARSPSSSPSSAPASGRPTPPTTFVATAADAYRAGATAAGALAPLTRQELASAGGDAAVPLAGAGPAAVADAGSALLRQWTSIVYMAMAQLGVPHARAGDPNGAGWAFAGPADAAAEAHGLARSCTAP